MGAKFEIARIRGLPVFVDMSFIILIVLWGQNYFTSGSTVEMSIGILLIIGLALSILIHELAHAVTGYRLGVPPSHIELNGLGGLCYWAGPMTKDAWRRIAISLVGPLSNYILYWLFTSLTELQVVHDNRFIWRVAAILAWANWWMCIFNLLPAFPLDGGKALEALLGKIVSLKSARLAVGVLGLCVCAYFVYLGIEGNTWMLVLAVLLGLENYNAVQGAANPPWQRWN